MTKATRGRPCRFTDEQMADIAYAYYTADKGKESKEQILSEHGISIAQFYKNMKKLDVKFFVQIGNGQIVEATGF
ncbi:hypothetical protein E3M25_003409 [Escherichia coli]|uniref:hypothetical protein n=1 Tax=Escherichia coli TaxID=562 RepID=UPI000B716060|nr:hypothetical protein [Escherichia coli]EEU2139833.1 hypothetical protein [Escherichia coli]EFE2809470.1 hypothetical protein [Escherichia coli]EIA8450155.1 hypothetical protein [Escherichia coli]EJL4602858.1 hypothetical protein [Escherichia coli]EJU1411032.1 hypothetical protein [Escherichia coli]